MASHALTTVLFAVLYLIYNAEAQGPAQGPAGGGAAGFKPGVDNTEALLSAWKAACAAGGTITIPKGVFPVGVVQLSGPCKGPITLDVQGTVQAPATVKGDGWITFDHVDGLTVSGGGTFDGQGQSLWKTNICAKNVDQCQSQAISLRFDFVNNVKVTGITSLNAKMFHANVFQSGNVAFTNFKATAPADSPTTDGIHIAKSKGVSVTDSEIGTGDDCISIGDGSQNITITKVKCGPGHGISIGSLGRYDNEEPVKGIVIKDCTLTGTDNGVRIKSWPARTACEASDIHFEGLTMDNVANPILIDQMYCPNNQCDKQAPSKVKISGVTYKDITGTTSTPLAINLACSSAFPCEGIEFSNVNIKSTGGPAKAQCTNVKPTITGTVTPTGC